MNPVPHQAWPLMRLPLVQKRHGVFLFSSRAPTRPLSCYPHRLLCSGKPVVGGTGRTKKVRPQGEQREVSINNAARLKVAGGVAKGRRLESPDVFLRPMMAKVGVGCVCRVCRAKGKCCGCSSPFACRMYAYIQPVV